MPAHPHLFDAVVLAGGRSSRLGGTDKPGLVVGGQTLLGSVVSAVTSAGAARVVVVGPERPAVPGAGAQGGLPLTYTREEPPGRGPVAALRCGLAEVSAPALVLAAADLPFLRPAHVARLLAALAGPAGAGPARAGAVALDAAGRPQWLLSAWASALLRGVLDGYAGSSLRGLLAPLDPVLLPDETAAGQPPPWLDCDTAEDLRLARDWAARAGSHAAQAGSGQEAAR
ncbi:MAG TPA: NTP transferase domain-containing protein [Streptosporangiaceae bacterium]